MLGFICSVFINHEYKIKMCEHHCEEATSSIMHTIKLVLIQLAQGSLEAIRPPANDQ